ncbi:MAG: integrin alpha [Patescibacteria group bacterium]
MSFLCLPVALLVFPLATFSQEEYNLSLFEEFTGEAAGDYVNSVSSAGDVNNDGYDDILIGAPANDAGGSGAGAAYLIYGRAEGLTGATLSEAVKFTGEAAGDAAGQSISSAGDVNNDGYDDILIGANGVGAWIGAVYLIYGQATPYSGTISLADADAKFTGGAGDDEASISVSSAGDVNNDGYDDILISAYGVDAYTGAVYLIYGQATPYSGTISLADTDAKFTGEAEGDEAGVSVSSAGDVNNDGYDDILIGADSNNAIGAAYLIYGQADLLDDASLSTAVKFTGEAAGDWAGSSVSSAGDVNNDDYDDILVGAPSNDAGGSGAGAAYLIYGQADLLDDASLSTAVKFIGEAAGDGTVDVYSAGDVNNDGYDDILIGAYKNDDGGADAGAAYLIYGQADLLDDASLSTAVKFIGEAAGDWAGNFVSSAGDVNNDGFDDILANARNNGDGGANAGAAYLGYLYIDNDGDGVAGGDGLFDGTDCNDDDATVSANQTYYQDSDGDGLGNTSQTTSICSVTVPAGYVANATDLNDNDHDNDSSETGTDCNDDDATINANQTYYQDYDTDGLGNPLVTTSVCSLTPPTGYVTNDNDTNDTIINNGVEIDGDNVDNDNDGLIDEVNNKSNLHPQYSTYDALDEDLYASAVVSVEGYKRGNIKVTYADNSIYVYSVSDIPTFIHKTQIKQYQDTGYYLILNPLGRLLALVDVYDGNILSRKTLSSKISYKYNAFQILTLNEKKYVVITSKKLNKITIRLAAIKFNIGKEQLGVMKKVTFNESGIIVSATQKDGNNIIQLLNKNNKVLKEYKLTKKFNLVEI